MSNQDQDQDQDVEQQQAVTLPGETDRQTEVDTVRQPETHRHCSKSFCVTPVSELDLLLVSALLPGSR